MDAEEIKKKLRIALPHFRLAMEEAKKEAGPDGKVGLGVIAMLPNGQGRVTARFEAPEFFEDLAALIGAPASTSEEVADARAKQFLDQLGLSGPRSSE